jgi:tRNA A22 N-methylase
MMMKKSIRWDNSFEVITQSIEVSGDDAAPFGDDDDEVVKCVCKTPHDGRECCLDDTCLNYTTFTECISCNKSCGNNRLLRKKFKSVEVRESGDKGFGLYANEDIHKKDLVIEYVGEIISAKDLEARFAATDPKKAKHLYIMQLKPKVFVDARFKGDVARFFNHSCEPNCKMDIWTVGGHLKLGIFALKDISKETELTLDYQWKPSDRPPTVCLCGTPSCRGYLEVQDAKTKLALSVLQGKPGNWISCRERELLSDPATKQLDDRSSLSSVFDEKGKVIPSNLIGKYIKLWSEEKQVFIEMQVEDYNSTEDSFECKDLIKKTVIPVELNRLDSNWYYFDESAEPLSIKKRTMEDEEQSAGDAAITEQQVSSSELPDSFPIRTTTGMKESESASNLQQLKKLSRESITMKYSWAYRMILEQQKEDYEARVQRKRENPEENDDNDYVPEPYLDPNDKDAIIKRYNHFLTKHCGIRGVVNSSNCKEFDESGFKIEVVGEETALQQWRKKLREIFEMLRREDLEKEMKIKNETLSKQSSVFIYDWRFRPLLSQSTSNRSYANWFREHSKIITSINELMSKNASFVELKYIPFLSFQQQANDKRSDSGRATEVNYHLSMSVEKSLFNHLKKILEEKFQYSSEIVLHSFVILSRYLISLKDSAIKDTVIILSAVILLTLKSYSFPFKSTLLKKICYSTYCQVNNRSENYSSNEMDSISHLLPKIQEKELEIYLMLNKDCYFTNIFVLINSLIKEMSRGILYQGSEEIITLLMEETISLTEYLFLNFFPIVLAFQFDLLLLTNFFIVYSLLFHEEKMNEDIISLKLVHELLQNYQFTTEMLQKSMKFIVELLLVKSSESSGNTIAGRPSLKDDGDDVVNYSSTLFNNFNQRNLTQITQASEKLLSTLNNLYVPAINGKNWNFMF